jgi:paraquat-inducible protein B
MSNSDTTVGGASGGGNDPSEAVVAGRSRFSPIWLIPIVALVVAASMAYQAIETRGIGVVVVFDSAQGIKAGKSVVKYRDMEVGSVDLIRFADLEHVELHLTLDKSIKSILTDGTKWWVVRPRFGGGAISGLGTIMSGSYVTFEPAKGGGAAQRKFVGLVDPPLPAAERSGLTLLLHTDRLGGLEAGSPIFFRDIHVGDVVHVALSQDGKTADVHAGIETTHSALVKSTSSFWNAGGIEVSVGSGGLDVKTESLKSLIVGGVAFDSPAEGEPAKRGAAYWLHSSRADVRMTAQTHGGLGLVLETGTLGGVSAGNPVYYREVPVGAVVSHELSMDASKVRVRINVEPRYASFVRSNSVFWNAGGISADLGLHGLHVHAESLKALLSGGIAFATPAEPGEVVGEGSVFALHAEAKDDWLKWQTDYDPKADDKPKKKHGLGHFFHHDGKSEEESKKEDPTPELTPDEHKHHFLRGLFHHGD